MLDSGFLERMNTLLANGEVCICFNYFCMYMRKSVKTTYTTVRFDDAIKYLLQVFLPFQVPGLFEGDEFAALMTQCKEGAQREGLMLDSNDELYKW